MPPRFLGPQALYDAPSKDKLTIEESLIRAKLAGERDIAAAYANHYLVPLYDPGEDECPPAPELAQLLPAKLCREHLLAPVAASAQVLQVALFSPDALLLIDELKLLTGRDVRRRFAPLSVIERLLVLLYEDGAWTGCPAERNGGLRGSRGGGSTR